MDIADPLAAFVTARLGEAATDAGWCAAWQLDHDGYGSTLHATAEHAKALAEQREVSDTYWRWDDGTYWLKRHGETLATIRRAPVLGVDPARALADIAAKRKRLALYLEAKAALEDILKGFRAEETPANFHMHAAQRQKREQAAGRFIAFQTSVKLDAMTWADHADFDLRWNVEG